MTRVIRHYNRELKTLYNLVQLREQSDDADKVFFLSDRDLAIIFTAIEKAGVSKTRVFTQAEFEDYTIATDDEWWEFNLYLDELNVHLGEWNVSNLLLERIAIALESLDGKAEELVEWDDFIDDLENALGVGNAFVEILKLIRSFIPSLAVKINPTKLLMSIWEYFTWKAPIIALLTTINASLGASAAAAIAEKPLLILRTIFDAFNSLLNLNNRIYEFILGDWSWWDDILKPLWDSFINTGDGGTGGDDPDNDPTTRVAVNLSVQNNIAISLDSFCCALEQMTVDTQQPFYVASVDSTWTGNPGDTPTNPNWPWQPSEPGDKCRAAWYIVNWVVLFYNSEHWNDFPTSPNVFSLVQLVRRILADIPPIGVSLASVSRFIGYLLSYLGGSPTARFQTVAQFTTDNREELMCILYTANDYTAAVDGFIGYYELNSDLLPSEIWVIDTWLRLNNVVALLFFNDDSWVIIPEYLPCECDDPCANFAFINFPPGETNEGEPMGVLTSGSMAFDTAGFTATSELGSLVLVPGEYVFFTAPNVEACYNVSIVVSGWVEDLGGVSAQWGDCSSVIQNVNVTNQTDLNNALADICIGPCEFLVIRGGLSEFTAAVTVLGYTCQ